MRKKWQVFVYLLLYIGLLAFVMGFDVKRLIDGKGMLVLLAGSLLLTLPFCRRGMDSGETVYIFGKKSVEAGLIQTFLLLFIRLSDGKGSDGILPDVALCFRPMLYAFCVKFTFAQEETEEGERTHGKGKRDESGRPQELPGADITYDDLIGIGLTKREAEIGLLVCKGHSNGEIAKELTISETTVKKHMSNIFEKTGIKRREELIKHCMRDLG